MSISPGLREELLQCVPKLRGFAVSLSGNREWADDLVQEALTKAWAKFDSFQEGTNLRAWLFTILRNEYYNQLRSRRREVEDVDGTYVENLSVVPAQEGHMDLIDFRDALSKLPPEQREALILVGASGIPYEDAAEICGCAVGTIKSRVSRGRVKLAELLGLEEAAPIGRRLVQRVF